MVSEAFQINPKQCGIIRDRLWVGYCPKPVICTLLAIPLCLSSKFYLQEEYDNWDAVADYIFRVTLLPVSWPRRSILLMEELQS